MKTPTPAGGTSAAGIAALALSVNPALGAHELRALLRATADRIGPAAYDENGHSARFGYGRLPPRRPDAATAAPAGSSRAWQRRHAPDRLRGARTAAGGVGRLAGNALYYRLTVRDGHDVAPGRVYVMPLTTDAPGVLGSGAPVAGRADEALWRTRSVSLVL